MKLYVWTEHFQKESVFSIWSKRLKKYPLFFCYVISKLLIQNADIRIYGKIIGKFWYYGVVIGIYKGKVCEKRCLYLSETANTLNPVLYQEPKSSHIVYYSIFMVIPFISSDILLFFIVL